MFLPDKELKKAFKIEAQKNPQKYYPFDALKNLGFDRKQCNNCNTFFWTTSAKKERCDDPQCSGGYRFIGNSPAKNKMDYIEVWKKFSAHFKKLGYTPVKRYPVVARWNPTAEFTLASIAAFQPFVVSGEVKPPANPLVIPQLCLRFNDIDNIGLTGAHFCLFCMMGQHAFVEPKKYDMNLYLEHIHKWITKGIGIPNNELTYHEDAWAGGGNFGSSMEFFSRGLEIGNQVYMQFDQSQAGEWNDLKTKVLDMGSGQERTAWFTNATSNAYEITFPTVCARMRKISGIKLDEKLMQRFLPYASYLNVDEVDDIHKTWEFVANKVGMDAKQLRQTVEPLSAVYSVGEHSRALLVAFNDSALPSNVGGGNNLRYILRRALDFIEEYGWKLDFFDLFELHAKYLKPIYPELTENLEDIHETIEIEKKKYMDTRDKAKKMVAALKASDLTENKLIELYDSHGISPQMVKNALPQVKIPDNFSALVAERHEKVVREAQTSKETQIPIPENVPETKILYYGDWKVTDFKAKIVALGESRGSGNNSTIKWVVLNETAFYPTSGGQLHDTGIMENDGKKTKIVDAFKQGKYIVHVVEDLGNTKIGDVIHIKADFERRKILMQHHTATHIINGLARKLFGNHVWQNSAEKTPEKGRIDVTHYDIPSDVIIKKLEKMANDAIKKDIKVNKIIVPKNEAEKKWGMALYQGGVAPGAYLRVVEIPTVDVQACGGTHANHTSDVEGIKITSVKKIQDNVIRFEYVAGDRLKEVQKETTNELEEIRKMVGNSVTITPELVKASAGIFSVQPEVLAKTLKRFIEETNIQKKELGSFSKELGEDHKPTKSATAKDLFDYSQKLFILWKDQRRQLESLKEKLAKNKSAEIKNGFSGKVSFDMKTMLEIASKLEKVFLVNAEGFFVIKGNDEKFMSLLKLGAKGGGKDTKQGMIPTNKMDEALNSSN